jgi:uncharacterized oligopeptide transporter (OPT) family protein
MTRTLTIAYRFSHYYKEKIFAILVGAIILTACFYVFLLQRAIVNVVERQHVSIETKSLSANVSDLEEQYFSMKNKITLDLAHSKGLKDASTISYISKKSVTAYVSHNEL